METMAVRVTAEATGSSGSVDPRQKFAEPQSPQSPRDKPPPLNRSSNSQKTEFGTPNASYEHPHGAYTTPDLPNSLKSRYPKDNPFYPTFKNSISFTFPSPSKPPPPELSYSVSSPALPYCPEGAVVSLLTGKYRPRTRSPSDGADVRWYYCKIPLGPHEKAASVPALEVVGKGEYFRFSFSDSSTLEAAFLQREEELVTAWWKEYAESRDGPSNTPAASTSTAYRQVGVTVEAEKPRKAAYSDPNRYRSSRSFEGPYDEDESVGVIVKGGLYEVYLHQRRCSPVYWRRDHRRVLRGHWFALKGGLDWLPVREDIAEQLEIAYESKVWRRRRYQPSGLFAARVDLHGATEGLHALFTGEDDTWEAWLCVDASRISFVLGLRTSDVRLRRGFLLPQSAQPTQDEIRQRKEEEMDDYACKVPVRHVVFMVHGIGQRLEKANLVDDVKTFRHTVDMLAEQHLTQYQRNTQRVLFIPCQWRRGLKLGGEQAVDDCTLEGVRALRTMLSATVHDVLYYMSPVYCQDIIDSVSHSLNRLYGKFIKRNPNYDGKVSIYGHSLGSVLSYDILCHQRDLVSSFPIMDVRPEADDTIEEGVEGSDEVTSEDDRSMSRGTSNTVEDSMNIEAANWGGSGAPINEVNLEDSESTAQVTCGPEGNSLETEEKSGETLLFSPATHEVLSVYTDSDAPEISEPDEENSSEKGEIPGEGTLGGVAQDVETNVDRETDVSHKTTVQSRDTRVTVPTENLSEDVELNGYASRHQSLDASTSGLSDVCESEKTELEALREEVKLLRERLASLTVEQTHVNELRSFPSVSWQDTIDGQEENIKGDALSGGVFACSSNNPSEDEEASRGPSEANDYSEEAEPSRLGPKSTSKKHFTPYISYTKLDFKVDTFYAVGSPLGVFLSLRNIRLGIGEGQDYWNDDSIEEEMPCVRQMLNIFHPYDPVAYRIEPLVCREFVEKRPTFIPYHKGGKRLHIGMQEFGEEMSARSRAIVDSLSSVGSRVASAFSSGAADKNVEENSETKTKEKTYGTLMMERLTGGPEGRMDYMLQDATFEHQYISVMSSHTAYWHDLDTALFILRHLYKDIPEQPRTDNTELPGPVSEDLNESRQSNAAAVTKAQDDSDPDDLPLTFSGRKGVTSMVDDAKNVKPGFIVQG
ncbi:hypothetical protein R1flu_028358 [Riccia fluitans]|uniref:DDHD domain-containing protein n=1 Tax=Riccia fluitans TaxID=41844 RepID=A0ABD1XLF4_9MARC